ncbi:MAG: hypothetical protein M3R02_10580 [Chloroflexota bacterium]|jgi:hypothetical protein|nr:hypothetical protein [Chloroflexota bacterium]
MSASDGHNDGLAALQARRASSRKRELPKSQNPTKLPPYRPPVPIDLRDVTDQELVSVEPEPPSHTVLPTPPTPEVKTPTRKVGLYLEEPHEDFLEAVRVAGNALRPRVNLSGSAVVRLAMDRLMAELSPEQVRDALVAKPLDPSAAGRPRR